MKSLVLALVAIASVGVGVATAAEAIGPDRPLAYPGQSLSTLVAQQQGRFVTVEQDHATTGTARIVTDNGQRYVEFDSAFDTARGPAVEVILHKAAAIPVNLTEGDYVSLAPLQSFTGAQRYAIPAEVDLSNFQTVGIWCRQFNVTFGYAPI